MPAGYLQLKQSPYILFTFASVNSDSFNLSQFFHCRRLMNGSSEKKKKKRVLLLLAHVADMKI